MAKLLVFVAVSLVFLPYCLANTVITLEDNGYRGIVVAIRSTITEDPELIDNIKELFTKASEFLHTATRGQTYYKDVTIAVPSTWLGKAEYETVLSDYFTLAHVRIDIPNPENEDSPYTLQTGGCGEPGQYIHLTPRFVKGIHDEMLDKFGPPERQLVHEWAHLRYGVFDEYGIPGDPRFPTFYQDSGKVRPTSCIKDIKGWIESKDGGPCSIMEGGYVDKDCVFVPDMHNQDVTASIMFMPFIPSMEGFCDKTDDRFHNVRAPTRQNALCQYRSTWSIIAKHSDFTETNRTKRQAPFVEPTFRIVRHRSNDEARLVLVLDVSGSMSGRPIELLYQAAVRFVADKVPTGSYLGVVQFSTFARTLHNLTKVNERTRKSLIDSLPSIDDGGTTAIGKGLTLGLRVLKNFSDDNSVEGGMIILITDGEENVAPHLMDVLPGVIREKVIVNTVAFGSDASHKLENVTKATGGKGFFFKDLTGTRPTTDLDAAFLESITSQADIDLQPVKITDDDRLSIGPYEETTRTIWLDKELGKNTIFTVLSTEIDGFDMTITEPKGRRYDAMSPEYNKDKGPRNRIQVTIQDAKSGLWIVEFKSKYHLHVRISLSVTSEPKDVRVQPVRVRSWISDFQLKFPAHAKVYAEVKKGYSAVVGAKVTATVERPVGGSVDIPLKDNGAGADIMQNDGVYSAYFTQFNGNGRYAVVANMANDGGAKLKKGTKASSAIPIPKFAKNEGVSRGEPADSFPVEDFFYSNKSIEEDDKGEPLEQLQRSSDTGAFRVEDWKNVTKDIIPPGNITDLVVVSAHESTNRYVTLKWTSPGGDLDNGNLSHIELRADLQPEMLLTSFNETFLFDSHWVENGTLEPLPVGELQTVTLGMPDFFFPNNNESTIVAVYFAVRGIDKDENISPGFNLALANFGVENHIKIKSTDQEPQKKPFRWWPAVLGIGLAVLLMIILLVTLVVIFHRKKNSRKFERVYCD